MALRYDSPSFMRNLASQIPPDTNVTVMHLGRGGVLPNGMLDGYNKKRVRQTLSVAYVVEAIQPSADVQILWTGGHNRKQDRRGGALYSEAWAARRYARTQTDDQIPQRTEEKSTSTVENATRSAGLIPNDSVIVVVSDKLHYLAWKIQFIFWLVFPNQKVVFVKLDESPPGTSLLSRGIHLASTVATVVGMIGVHRGDPKEIQARQDLLQRRTWH